MLAAVLAGGTAAVPAEAAAPVARAFDSAVTAAQDAGETPSEEVALAAAKAGGEPVEVTRLREERREVFANPQGTFTAQEYTQPVRTQRGGTWVPVDDTLVQRADGGWSPKAATVEIEFSGGGTGAFARMNRAGREYALTWPKGALPQPQVDGNVARYAEVLPGVDLAVRADAEGFAHYLIIKTAAAAANPALDQIELGLSAKGLTVEENADGSLKAVDAAVGGTVFESGRAIMWDTRAAGGAPAARTLVAAGPAAAPKAELDAADGGRKASVELEVTGNKITLTPDAGLLRGAKTVYPVVVDPIPRTTSRTAWTSVMSGMPNEQDWAYSGSAGMGKCPTNYNPTQCAGIGVRRLLFTFPTSFYAGKQIISSQFSARVESVYWADARAEPVDLYRIGGKNYNVTSGSNWSNTKDDWSDYLMTTDTAISPTSCSSTGTNLNMKNGELLAEVQAAAAGSWSSMSLGLKAKDESDFPGWKRICGNTFLKIEYNTPPQQVDYRLMSSNPGGKCVRDAATAPYTDVLPQLSAEARDPDHTASNTDQVKMQFQVFYTDTAGAERNYVAETGYKSPSAGTAFTHQVVQPTAGNGVGMWAPSSGTVYERNAANAGGNDAEFKYGSSGMTPLSGDWNGDGVDSVGMYDPSTSTFYLRNSNNAGGNDYTVKFGNVGGDLPVVGDWNGDGKDTIGVWRPSNHIVYLNNELTNSVADLTFAYGGTGMTPIGGDWDGDGVDTIGMYHSASYKFFVRNSNSAGVNSYEMYYGSPGDKPVVGDWNGDKIDTIGVWRPSNHYYYLNNESTNNVADLSFIYGGTGMLPIIGTWRSDASIPATSLISWQARAFDGDAWGPWSSANGGLRCFIRRDAQRPKAPVVTADPYKADETVRDGVGTPGAFTFDAEDSDVQGYRYTFDGEATAGKSTTNGAPVTVNWTPLWAGRHSVTVEAKDGAGNTSSVPAYYEFLVSDGKAPAGQWNLADPVGSPQAHDETADHAATAGSGAAFGVSGPGGTADYAAHLDGSAGAYLDAGGKVVDTNASFSVSAWVKPAAVDRTMAVVSQDGTDESGFVLGYDAVAKAFVFSTPDADGEMTTRYQAKATGYEVTAGQWYLVTGVYDATDPAKPQLKIYVNDHAAWSADRLKPWSAPGNFQIGRAMSAGAYRDSFQGDLAEVRAYDRILPPAQVAELMTVKPTRKAYWQLDQATENSVANVQANGAPLLVHGASIYQQADELSDPALAGSGHLQLDGVDDWADTAAPVVSGAGSFTVAVRARLTSLDPTKSQTVLSLPGHNADRLVVRYQAATQRWELAVTDADSASPKVTTVTDGDSLPTADASGSHLAVTYDAFTHQLRLYVDGNHTDTATGVDATHWPSTGGVQIGRSAQAGGSAYFAGAIDEVRMYEGAVDQVAIQRMAVSTPVSDL
ncbi:LamG-like jellyroll fold domain-containing protein [Streptomyces sp. H39-S7]|uniref:LamG-like jellyroll fold domain-containing protein n=1 Tax=Streptomyces sp. H39-S7 TaxID=3004357 RepID=UPI0022AF01F0|nr:LamG-like jellyroll fold domain-containing protein [Streptomyces sp. H39-S7]MCZ4119140.1 hypothetical protein [Streptomyces sp. H39-S7]